jgi:hypothetical protein
VFRELIEEGLAPWSTKQILIGHSMFAAYGVDTTDYFDLGVQALEAHAQYLGGLGENAMADPREFLEAFARQTGSRLGVRFAVSFEVVNA